jgi:hypothetical protein
MGYGTFTSCATDDYFTYCIAYLTYGMTGIVHTLSGCYRKSDFYEEWGGWGKVWTYGTGNTPTFSTYYDAQGVMWRGTVPAETLNEDTGQYETHWYGLCYKYDSMEISDSGSKSYNAPGVFFVDLGTSGYFPEDPKSAEVILCRDELMMSSVVLGGGMQTLWSVDNTYHENNGICVTNYNQEIFFTVYRGTRDYIGLSTYDKALWRYNPKSEYYRNGNLICVSQALESWSFTSGALRFQGCCLHKITSGGRHYSNYVDDNPCMVVYRLLNAAYNYDLCHEFSGEHLWMIGDYSIGANICKELVNDKVYWQNIEYDIVEPRFLYSRAVDKKWKMHDLITDILQTCNGFLAYNGRYYDIKIPNANETVQHYFGIDEQNFTSNQLSDNKKKIYADFSSYPEDYWTGDFVYFQYDGLHHEGLIVEHDSVSLTVADYFRDSGNNTFYFPDATSFKIIKDNIKRGTFTFSRTSKYGTSNVVRIEYVNRLMEYTQQVVEAVNHYDVQNSGYERKTTYSMPGIKRATQAGRRAMFELDYQTHCRWLCSFITDVIGFRFNLGDIIAVTHPVTLWDKKEFRIVSLEELADYEVRFELEEYNRNIFHDIGVPVIQGTGNSGPTVHKYHYVTNLRHFEVIEDSDYGCVYFSFAYNEVNENYKHFYFVQVFVPGEYGGNSNVSWVKITSFFNIFPVVVRLAQSLDSSPYQDKVYYDPNTLVGTFPDDGYFYMNNVLFRYRGVDTSNNCFVNCVQGVDHIHKAQAHQAGDMITERESIRNTRYDYDRDSWVDEEIDFRGCAGFMQYVIPHIMKPDSAPGHEKTILAVGNMTFPPALLQYEEEDAT